MSVPLSLIQSARQQIADSQRYSCPRPYLFINFDADFQEFYVSPLWEEGSDRLFTIAKVTPTDVTEVLR